MSAWIRRALGALAGATLGAFVVGAWEGTNASRVWAVPVGDVILGDAAVIVPLAALVGLLIAAVSIALDPGDRSSVRSVMTAVRRLRGDARSGAAAVGLLTPAALLAWLVGSAQWARVMLAGGAPAASGVALAVVSGTLLAFVFACVFGALPFVMRRVTGGVPPLVAAACGATYAVCAVAIGIRIGDASGNGPTPLSILGVLARPELDLSPVCALGALTLGAWLGKRIVSVGRTAEVLVAIAFVGGAWALLVHESMSLSAEPEVARAIEMAAPFGRFGLALARRATDRDNDGSSALFGGGDCDDEDPHRSPLAIDIPGNGIDEDCSGADLPAPREPMRPPKKLSHAAFRGDLNLVLITVDTLRIDLGFMGYPRPVSPNLDALAARSTVFERAYAMASYTGKSVGPTMIGKYPSECFRDGAHFDTYFSENTFLAERLHAAGFRTMGAASHWYFKPKYGLTQGMDVWDMSAMPPDMSRDADSSVTSAGLTDAAIGLLSQPSNVDRRFFLWVHYFDPHANYAPHADAPDFRDGAKGWAKPLYDGEVWFTDHHLGRLLDFIASQPWGSKTAIVVTADHGEAFDEHGMNWHGVDLWEPLVRVPLVVFVPGVKAHRVSVKRSLVDVVPTVLELLALSQPSIGELSGLSTAPAILWPDEPEAMEERDVFMDMPAGPQVSQHRALIHGPTPGLKLMSEGAAWYFLFDLSEDPGELHDLGRDRAKLGPMRAAFDDKLSALHTILVAPAPYQAR